MHELQDTSAHDWVWRTGAQSSWPAFASEPSPAPASPASFINSLQPDDVITVSLKDGVMDEVPIWAFWGLLQGDGYLLIQLGDGTPARIAFADLRRILREADGS